MTTYGVSSDVVSIGFGDESADAAAFGASEYAGAACAALAPPARALLACLGLALGAVLTRRR